MMTRIRVRWASWARFAMCVNVHVAEALLRVLVNVSNGNAATVARVCRTDAPFRACAAALRSATAALEHAVLALALLSNCCELSSKVQLRVWMLSD